MTNGDRIRQMSNEELVKVINASCEHCLNENCCDFLCTEGIKAYLDREAE